MDTVTIYGTDRGAAPVVCPPFCVATYTLNHKDKSVTVLFILKTKADDSTYAALDRAVKKFGLPRSAFELVPYYQAAFVENGSVEEYALVHLFADKSSVLHFDAKNSSVIAGGKSVETTKKLIEKFLSGKEEEDGSN